MARSHAGACRNPGQTEPRCSVVHKGQHSTTTKPRPTLYRTTHVALKHLSFLSFDVPHQQHARLRSRTEPEHHDGSQSVNTTFQGNPAPAFSHARTYPQGPPTAHLELRGSNISTHCVYSLLNIFCRLIGFPSLPQARGPHLRHGRPTLPTVFQTRQQDGAVAAARCAPAQHRSWNSPEGIDSPSCGRVRVRATTRE